tara:strand:- start:242 stop:586 length:345 start_codon:yes stop_codon:yes gene_type:complete
MRDSKFSVRINISNSVWFKNFRNVEYDKKDYSDIVETLVKVCEEKRGIFKSSYNYDIIVDNILAAIPEHKKTYLWYYGLHHLLKLRCDHSDWYDGANAARRVIECKLVYMSPSF